MQGHVVRDPGETLTARLEDNNILRPQCLAHILNRRDLMFPGNEGDHLGKLLTIWIKSRSRLVQPAKRRQEETDIFLTSSPHGPTKTEIRRALLSHLNAVFNVRMELSRHLLVKHYLSCSRYLRTSVNSVSRCSPSVAFSSSDRFLSSDRIIS